MRLYLHCSIIVVNSFGVCIELLLDGIDNGQRLHKRDRVAMYITCICINTVTALPRLWFITYTYEHCSHYIVIL